MTQAAPESEWRAHWRTPTVSLFALAFAFLHIYTTGVFLAPLQEEFGWSRTAATAGLTIVSVVSVLLAPLFGFLIDRFGPRRIAIPGLILYFSAFAALSMTSSSLLIWWLLWFFVGLGNVCVKPTVWAAAITQRFAKHRGMAMAIALTGSGLGGMFLPFIATWLVEMIGWRSAFAAMGLGALVCLLPLVFLLFARDEKSGSAQKKSDRSMLPGLSAREAFRSSRYIRLAIANLLITVSLLALIVHLVPILTEGGLDRRDAAVTAGIIGLATVVGRLLTGFLLDRLGGPVIGLLTFLLPAIACALLMLPQGMVIAISAAFLIGLAVGSEVDIVMYMASRYFGVRNFGLLYGTLGGITSLGTGLGPLLSSMIYDATGSYDAVFPILLPMIGVAALLVSSLGRYPDFSSPASDSV